MRCTVSRRPSNEVHGVWNEVHGDDPDGESNEQGWGYGTSKGEGQTRCTVGIK